MKRRGHLNQALQEGLLRLRFNEPYLFPKFMSFEEFLRIEMRHPLFKFLFSLGGFHFAAEEGALPIIELISIMYAAWSFVSAKSCFPSGVNRIIDSGQGSWIVAIGLQLPGR